MSRAGEGRRTLARQAAETRDDEERMPPSAYRDAEARLAAMEHGMALRIILGGQLIRSVRRLPAWM